MPLRQQRPLLGILCRLSAILLFSAMWAAAKLASELGATTIEVIFYRALFAFPVVCLWIVLGPGWQAVTTAHPRAHVIRGCIGIVSMFFNFYAIILLPLAEATTIGFTAPIMSTVLAAVLLGEPVGRYRWGATLVGFLGVLIVMWSGLRTEHIAAWPMTVGLIAAFGVSAVMITLRQISGTETATATVFWFTIFMGLASALLMPFFGGWHGWHCLALLAITGLFGAGGQLLMTASLRYGSVAALVPFDYSQLLWATLLGFWLWGKLPLSGTLAGSVLIIGAGLFTAWRERVHQRAARTAFEATSASPAQAE